MSFIDYIITGFLIVFFIDAIIVIGRHHPKIQMEMKRWGFLERITCILIWPVALAIFLNAFIKQYFKK